MLVGNLEKEEYREKTYMVKVKSYIQLLKMRLSLLVAFSAAISYLFKSNLETIAWVDFILFTIAGFLVTGSANIINQVIERKLDLMMNRTKERPLPSGNLSVVEAVIFSVLLGIIGLMIHYYAINWVTALWSFISLILYGFVYTPLKRVGSIAVFVGAFPGALPLLIGWLAVTGEPNLLAPINYGGLVLFTVQFMWQFPHFWAIAWVGDEDYQKAGFGLLPIHSEATRSNALIIAIYTFFLILVSALPYYVKMVSLTSTIVAVVTGILFFGQTIYLIKEQTRKAALMVMFGSFIYIPVVFIGYLVGKI
ncbi:MAG: protoheme IX farnesyltransferase [Cytophagales bacterium]|nr:protoheme IX farnesyltransferase [Cytophagales bacterium]